MWCLPIAMLAVAGCGRGGFDATADAGRDAPADVSVDALLGSTVVTFGEGADATVTSVTIDTWLNGAGTGENYGTAPILEADDLERVLIRFELSTLPPPTQIATARLRLWTNSNTSPSGAALLYGLREAWVEGGQTGMADAANWSERAPGLPWAGAGASGASRDPTLLGSFMPSAELTAYDVDLPLIVVQQWVTDSATNFGVVFEVDSGDGADFFSSEALEVDRRPSLQVSYEL